MFIDQAILDELLSRYGHDDRRKMRISAGVGMASLGMVKGNGVDSSCDHDTIYKVTRQFPFFWKWKCTCPDYTFRSWQVGYCKHVYAMLAERMKQ